MYKLVVLAVVLASANAGIVGYGAPYLGGAPFLAGAPLAYNTAPLAINGAPLAYHAAPLSYAIPAPVATNYALPPAREIELAPIVETAVEPVEQHGYSIRY